MAEIDIDYELKHVSGILSDVETIDLPWNEQEVAGFDWFMAVWAVKKLIERFAEMNETQRKEFESIRARMMAADKKLTELGFTNPFLE